MMILAAGAPIGLAVNQAGAGHPANLLVSSTPCSEVVVEQHHELDCAQRRTRSRYVIATRLLSPPTLHLEPRTLPAPPAAP